MNLNDSNNIINILSNIDETQESNLINLSYSLYMFKKQKDADVYYQASQVSLAPEVIEWAKKQLIKQLRSLKKNDEDDTNQFYVGDYNDEIQRKEQLAKLDLSNSLTLQKRKEDLISALRTTTDMYDEKLTNFIVARVMFDGKEALFSYYRGDKGAKKNTGRKTKRTLYKNTNQFEFVEHTVIELGGNFDLMIIEDFIFINQDTHFQHTFDYRDEIYEKTEANLALITSMPFFEGTEANTEEFQIVCKRFINARSLAQIKPETLGALQDKFEERCSELSILRQNIPQNPEEQENYKKELGTIWELFEFIDFDNKKIKFKKGESPKPLIHFFADKIARSFLTEKYKVVAAYE
ncbi:Kiwa anti-phage protein KwaB-like domain-containing protein [Bacillus pumilus]|uniref:Kiwa anti-phage protein KwaB-like domain-containing protein n=1 Tax=Bacillus pumilus TaxID=1408 RepID=UPI0011A62B2E|nr:Kiwa anti-phage protein KwaB-like domain-containing protein [Bacillus pumilus]